MSCALLVSLLPFTAFDGISGSGRHKYNAEQKKNKEEAFYWSSIRILLVMNENSRQKLMAVNEIRIAVTNIVWNVMPRSLCRQKGCHVRNSC